MPSMYDKKITSDEPTLMVFLIDQSGSMGEPLAEKEGVVYTIAKIAKILTDTFLYESIRRCQRGNVFKPYIDFAIIGYGVGVHSALPKIPLEQFPFSITKLADAYIAKNDSNTDDNSMIPKPKLEWTEERADGQMTPTLAAFTKAREIIEKWLPDHQTSFPPIVINISDGAPNDDPVFNQMCQEAAEQGIPRLGDLSQTGLITQSKAIQGMGTEDGKCLVGSIQLDPSDAHSLQYPSSIVDETGNIDTLARLMFEMSSVIPDSLREWYNHKYANLKSVIDLEPGARFYTLNADFDSDFYFKTGGSEARFDPK